jgi:hypothetical protein
MGATIQEWANSLFIRGPQSLSDPQNFSGPSCLELLALLELEFHCFREVLRDKDSVLCCCYITESSGPTKFFQPVLPRGLCITGARVSLF